ncbi:unnamed protein product [Chrysoparadoxa australica]
MKSFYERIKRSSSNDVPTESISPPSVEALPTPREECEEDNPIHLNLKLSLRTDIGGMVENQDDCFVWRHGSSGSVVIGVLDGHGRDVGQLAAQGAKAFMLEWLDSNWETVLQDPAAAMRVLFSATHSHLRQAFRDHLTSQGWVVKENNGYLMKRRSLATPWSCVHGGTSGSLVAIVQGKKLVIANVGDSSAIMAAKDGILGQGDLRQHSWWDDGGGEMDDLGTTGVAKSSDSQYLVLTADHSPESPREFKRMRNACPDPQNKHLPTLIVVYDSPSTNKLRCSPVFDVDTSGTPKVTGRGRYYKNVRHEWASLVATPMRARFQDALAFTRSLGDFHIQTYGVTHIPDVLSLDLTQVLQRAREQGGNEAVACIAACSDGIWDNWLWEDVGGFFIDRLPQVQEVDSSEAVTEEFMVENARRAKANFGDQADNATCVACYLFISGG